MRSPTSLLSIHKFYRYLTPLLLLVAAIALSSCDKGSPADMPTNVVLTPGEGKITVTWTMQPGVQYWLFYAPASSITVDNWLSLPGSAAVANVTSPYVLSGLTNGTTYAITLNGRYNNGPGGPGTASLTEIPRPAGTTWNLATAPLALANAGTALRAITYGSAFVTVGDGGTVYSSSDGITWTQQTTGVPAVNLLGITYSGQYIAVGETGTLLTSADATTWTHYDNAVTGTTNNLLAVAANGSGLYVAVGQHDTIRYSNNLTTWNNSSYTGTDNSLNAITYANGQFVVVGDTGTILTSTDGNNWNSVGPGTGPNLYGIAYGAGTYSAVGDGVLITSANATNWVVQNPAFGGALMRAAIYASQFITVGINGSIYTSTDGLNWDDHSPGGSSLYGIGHGNASYIAVGDGGNYQTSY